MCRSRHQLRSLALAVTLALAAAGCGDNAGGSSTVSGTTVRFDLDGNTTSSETFFDAPFPSDLRTHPDGRPNLTGYPNPRNNPIVAGLLAIADQRVGFPVLPAAYFRFDGELAAADLNDIVAADATNSLLLVNIGDAANGRGELVPLVAKTLDPEDFAPEHILAVAPRPGFVLRGGTRYAFVVRRSYGDAAGQPLGVPRELVQLQAGEQPDGLLGADALELYGSLWPVLTEIGVEAEDVAAALVFTTGDPVLALSQLSSAVVARDDVSVSALAIDADDGADHERYCELLASVDYDQYQTGTPPFNEGGVFDFGDDGLPIPQRIETAPIVVTIPKGEMPEGGYPLMLYFHGSGGRASTAVDAGPASEKGGALAKGLGPAHIVAEHGFASLASALPLSPDRLPGASDIAYLNFNNLAAFRDTFRQGVIEQRLLLEALTTLRIEPSELAGCSGISLPPGQSQYFFNDQKIVASGQSMGGMYTNLITPLEPLIGAAVPTGAGGMWTKMILETDLFDGATDFVAIIIGTTPDKLSFVHPGMHLIALGWEAAEPVAFMPRLARDPLPGMNAKPTYEPVGSSDIFFPTSIFDAAALSYGHQQAGEEVWPQMQHALSLLGRDGVADYPVSGNLVSSTGADYTGVVVQYAPDGIRNGHYIYAQLDEVKYQYGCFFASFIETGIATVPAPAALGTPCPGLTGRARKPARE